MSCSLVCSYALDHTIRLGGVDLLACLLDLFEDGRIVDALLGLDDGGLRVERHVVGLDTCDTQSAHMRESRDVYRGSYHRAS